MWLLVGLGNPGPSYSGNRHNAGFIAVDAIANKYSASNFAAKFHGEVAKADIAGEQILLLKPQTFMNLSGKSVLAAMSFYKIPPENVIVLHDDLDLQLGQLRIKQGGGHGGHNGLRDIDALIGKNYWRLRLGIGHPGDKEQVHGYVLSNFSTEQRVPMQDLYDNLAQQLPLFWQHSPSALMSKVALSANAESKN
jgi:PTH1 family peptidyl-tRNA hydrolase